MHKRILIITSVVALFLISGGVIFTMNKQKSNSTQNQASIQSHRSYEVEVTSNLDSITHNQPTSLSYQIKNDQGEILKDFSPAHEKLMHLIIVRKDLQDFQHVHPEYNESTGEFSVSGVTFPNDGEYRAFADFTPGDSAGNFNKLPVASNFDFKVGDTSRYTPEKVSVDQSNTKNFDNYNVLFTFPTPIKSNSEVDYSINISQNGNPITNLEKYLGALGHSVIIKEGTLEYIHTHAEEADGKMGPEIAFATNFPTAGVYKIFTQFQHLGKVVTTDFAINVEQGSAEEQEANHETMGH